MDIRCGSTRQRRSGVSTLSILGDSRPCDIDSLDPIFSDLDSLIFILAKFRFEFYFGGGRSGFA